MGYRGEFDIYDDNMDADRDDDDDENRRWMTPDEKREVQRKILAENPCAYSNCHYLNNRVCPYLNNRVCGYWTPPTIPLMGD